MLEKRQLANPRPLDDIRNQYPRGMSLVCIHMDRT
jgi:hypothetical protein